MTSKTSTSQQEYNNLYSPFDPTHQLVHMLHDGTALLKLLRLKTPHCRGSTARAARSTDILGFQLRSKTLLTSIPLEDHLFTCQASILSFVHLHHNPGLVPFDTESLVAASRSWGNLTQKIEPIPFLLVLCFWRRFACSIIKMLL